MTNPMIKPTETQLLEALIGKRGLARILGWHINHQRPAMIKNDSSPKGYAWRTAIQGRVGYPDILLAKQFPAGGRCVFMELKGEGGKPAPAQAEWLDILASVEGLEVYLAYPSDLDELGDVLTLGHVPNRLETLAFKSAWVNRRDA